MNDGIQGIYNTPIVDPKTGKITGPWQRWFRDMELKTRPVVQGNFAIKGVGDANTLSLGNEVRDANGYSRTKAAGVNGGYVGSVSQDGAAVFPAKGVGDPQTLSIGSEVADSPDYVRMTPPVSISAGGVSVLTQSGTTTLILVSSGTLYFGGVQINYNSGSVDPGAYGKYFVYFDLPSISPQTLSPTYHATADPTVTTRSPYRVTLGSLTTAGGGGGGGGTGGGGGGGCFTGEARIQTAHGGFVKFNRLPETVWIRNQTGIHIADLVKHEHFESAMIDCGGFLVTPDHLLKIAPERNEWLTADLKFPERRRANFNGTVYNLHVRSKREADMHYILETGDVAHNIKYQ